MRDLVATIIPSLAAAPNRQAIIAMQELEPARVCLGMLADIPADELSIVFDDLRFRFVTS